MTDQATTPTQTIFGAASTGRSSLNAALDIANDSRFDLFPVVRQANGPQGGAMAPAKGTKQELTMVLPDGRRPFNAVLIDYRVDAVVFAEGYDGTLAEPPKPVMSFCVPSRDVENMPLIVTAAKQYQFTKKENKTKFNQSAGGPGHMTTHLSLLCWLPAVNGLVVIQAASGFSGHHLTLESLRPTGTAASLSNKDGELPIYQGVLITPTSKEAKKAGIKNHYLVLAKDPSTEAAFQPWYQAALTDAAVSSPAADWIGGTDRPLTADAIKCLTAIAKL